MDKILVFYDGDCGMCNRLCLFLMDRDSNDSFRYISLQSKRAQDLLAKEGVSYNANAPETIYVLTASKSKHSKTPVLTHSTALLFLINELGGLWKLAKPLGFLPKKLRDRLYLWIASRRGLISSFFFPKSSCRCLTASEQEKFLS